MNELLKQLYDAGWKEITSQEFAHPQRKLVLFRENGQWLKTTETQRYSKDRARGAEKSPTLKVAIEKALAVKV